jgi:hypothetical protein
MNDDTGENTKLSQIRKAMELDDWDLALKIAARFRRLGEHKVKITRAAGAISHPETYQQMGYDVNEIKSAGINALKERFSKSWEIVVKRKGENESGMITPSTK